MQQRPLRVIRNVLFWVHLSVGVGAGLVVGVMALTGASIAFEPQILAWMEGPPPRVPTPGPLRPTVDELLERVRAARPGAEPAALVIHPDPAAAVRVITGRGEGVYVHPSSGEVQPLPAQAWRTTFELLLRIHRALGTDGKYRAVGTAVTGVAALSFFFLALSGLWLWWPRRWNLRALRPAIWFRRGLSGRARDWNWHNTLGFWLLPFILLISGSGVVIAYRWASNLVFLAVGETPPAPGGPAAPSPREPRNPREPRGAASPGDAPDPRTRPPSRTSPQLATLVAAADRETPGWTTITLRLRGAGGRGPALTVRQAGGWPAFATTQLTIEPSSGKVLRREGYADASRGRRVRLWLRFLHTGEALRWPGQLAAAVTALGSAALVWTGMAMALRRFRRRAS